MGRVNVPQSRADDWLSRSQQNSCVRAQSELNPALLYPTVGPTKRRGENVKIY